MQPSLRARIAGTLGAAVSLLTIFGLGIATPGHDMVRGYISTLGVPGEAYALWYGLGGAISSVLHLWFIAALAREQRATGLSAASLTLLSSFFVLHLLGTWVFPCATDCDWSTWESRLHYALGFAAFVAFTVGTILFSVWVARERPYSKGARAIHAATTLVVTCGVILLVADLADLWRGVAERLVAVTLAIWVATVAWATVTPSE